MTNSRHGNGKISLISSGTLAAALPAIYSRTGPYMRAALMSAVYFLLTLFLARGIVSQMLAPLGAAFVAAVSCTRTGSRLPALFALAGAVVGYALPSPADGLRYCAAAAMCFIAGMVLSDRAWMRRRFAPCALTAASLIATNTVYLFSYGAELREGALYICEIAMAVLAAYCYGPIAALADRTREAKTERPPNSILAGQDMLQRTGCIIGAGMSFVIVLGGITLPAQMNAGRMAALYISMAMCSADPLLGCACGIGGGIAAALGGGTGIECALVYSLSALFAGLFARFGGFAVASLFTVCHAALLIWLAPDTGMAAVYECFACGVIFYLSAQPARRAAQDVLHGFKLQREHKEEAEAAETVGAMLGSTAKAFEIAAQETAPVTTHSSAAETAGEKDIYTLALDRVCRNCELCALCYKLSGKVTREALEEAKNRILVKGHASPEDFPPFFNARCRRMTDFLGAVNEFIALRESRIRYARRARDDAAMLGAQYGAIVELFREISRSIAPADTDCEKENAALRSALARADIAVGLEAEKKRGRYICRVKSSAVLPVKLRRSLESIAGKTLGCTMRFKHDEEHGGRPAMYQSMAYSVSAAAAACPRSGQESSGDKYACFKTGDGLVYFIICDGMGSGAEACRESEVFLRMLEKFLRAGISPETALKLISPAYTIRCGGDSFTTCDILRIDLYTGQAVSYKCAAAPTYICPYGALPRKISSVTLPVGLAAQRPAADKCGAVLSGGDVVVMMSDGLVSEDERGMYAFLQQNRDMDVHQLASELLERGREDGEARDDMTVIAVRVIGS